MKLLAVLVCLVLSQVAHAQGARGGYMGGLLGKFDYEEPEDIDGLPVSDDTYIYHVFGGYQFNEHFALEGGIGRTGDLEESFPDFFPGFTLEVDQIYDIYTIRALGILPFDALSLFGGVGYFSASLSGPVDVAGLGQIGELDGHESGAVATLGVQRDFGLDLRNLSIRGQLDWYDFGNGIDAAGFTLGMTYRF